MCHTRLISSLGPPPSQKSPSPPPYSDCPTGGSRVLRTSKFAWTLEGQLYGAFHFLQLQSKLPVEDVRALQHKPIHVTDYPNIMVTSTTIPFKLAQQPVAPVRHHLHFHDTFKAYSWSCQDEVILPPSKYRLTDVEREERDLLLIFDIEGDEGDMKLWTFHTQAKCNVTISVFLKKFNLQQFAGKDSLAGNKHTSVKYEFICIEFRRLEPLRLSFSSE